VKETVQGSDSVVVEKLTKSFPKDHTIATWLRHRGRPPRFVAVSDVSFRVKHGELFGLLGENGAGKSTILQVLSGMVTPDAGKVVVNGVNAQRSPLRLREQIGLCSAEERSFYYRLTARANLRFFGELSGLHGRKLEDRVEEVAELVDLKESLDRRFQGFSSGMRQRLAIARALLADPQVLLLDEPTRAVDPVHAREIRSFVRSLVTTRGKTAVLCTNLLEEAWEICDRIAIIAAGRIVTVGRPGELLAKARRRRYAILFDEVDASVIARTRNVAGLRELRVEPYRNGVRMVVELDEAPRALTDLLRAVSQNGVSVTHVEADEVNPFQIYAGLAMEGRDAE
jgi:ABC-2 type transport system ATP-binding protein